MSRTPIAPDLDRESDELFSRDWLVDYDLRDEDGRPFAENKAGEQVRRAVPVEFRQCPYTGSRFRHAHPMNYSAFRQIGRYWGEMMHTVSYVRAAHLRRYPREKFDVEDLLWGTAALGNVQNFLFRRVEDPVADGALPALLGGMYKASVGVSGVSFALCVMRWIEGRDPAEPADAERIHAFAEARTLLVGAHEVCAGPPELIDRILRVMIHGEPVAAAPPLARLLPDLDAYLAYSTAMMRLEVARQALAIRHHSLVLNLRDALLLRTQDAGGVGTWLAGWAETEPSWRRAQSSFGNFNRWMAAKDTEVRARLLAGMGCLVERFRADGPHLPAGLFRDASEPPAAARARARAVVEAAPLASAEPDEAALVVDALARHLALEAEAAVAFDALRPVLAAALGRAAPPACTDADLTRSMGLTLRDVLPQGGPALAHAFTGAVP